MIGSSRKFQIVSAGALGFASVLAVPAFGSQIELKVRGINFSQGDKFVQALEGRSNGDGKMQGLLLHTDANGTARLAAGQAGSWDAPNPGTTFIAQEAATADGNGNYEGTTSNDSGTGDFVATNVSCVIDKSSPYYDKLTLKFTPDCRGIDCDELDSDWALELESCAAYASDCTLHSGGGSVVEGENEIPYSIYFSKGGDATYKARLAVYYNTSSGEVRQMDDDIMVCSTAM